MRTFLLLLVFASSSMSSPERTVYKTEPNPCTPVEITEYLEALLGKLYANWKVPYEDLNLRCIVQFKQDSDGNVLDVAIAKCTDKDVIRESVRNAILDSSPLSLPVRKQCFSRSVRVTLEHPHE